MHIETFLYMALQSDQLRAPGLAPDFALLAKQDRSAAVPNQWIRVPASTFYEGMTDPENDEGPDRYFGWDNEKPQRLINVPSFEAQARPLTNEDYARFLEQSGDDKVPASWIHGKSHTNITHRSSHINGNKDNSNSSSPQLTNAYLCDKFVRTIYGPIPLKQALDWPIFASYDELSKCAAWMNGRIPTVEEARSIYNYVDTNKNKHTDSIVTKKVSAVNGCDVTCLEGCLLI